MPAALIIVIPLGFLVMWVAIYGMQRGNNQWLVPLVNAFRHPQGSFLKRTALKAVGAALAAVSFIVRYVTHYLSVAASHGIGTVAHWIDGLTQWVEAVGLGAKDFAIDVEHGITRLAHQTLPREIHKATAVIEHTVTIGLKDLRHEIEKARRLARGIDTLVKDTIIPRVRAAERAITDTLPREIARGRAAERALADRIAHPSRAWLKRIWTAGWILVGAGLMLRFLTRKFPWLFCRNTTAAAKAVCGMDALLLDALLLETVAIAGGISVVAFTRELQAIEGEAISVMGALIEELP